MLLGPHSSVTRHGTNHFVGWVLGELLWEGVGAAACWAGTRETGDGLWGIGGLTMEMDGVDRMAA